MIAFTFPGQGSQRAGMGAAWEHDPSWELVDEASAVAGRDVGRLLLHTPDDELQETHNAQLATFVLSLVALDAVERIGIDAVAFAGHSLGEYTALVAAGVLSFEDGVRLVVERGDAMRSAADDVTGTMAAVLGLDDGKVVEACAAEATPDVWVANFNGPGQVVISGTPEGIDRCGLRLRELGAKRVLSLPVGGAFHSPLMSPAEERLRKALRHVAFRDSPQPVIANVDARPHADGAGWRDRLAAQLVSPVRWRQSLHRLADLGVSTIFELGPGAVLTGLAKRTLPDARVLSVNDPTHLDAVLSLLAAPGAGPVGYATEEGEHLHAVERVIVSPSPGVFVPADSLVPGVIVPAGGEVGRVNGSPVYSPFSGTVIGVMAVGGERLTPSQPIAWLRTA